MIGQLIRLTIVLEDRRSHVLLPQRVILIDADHFLDCRFERSEAMHIHERFGIEVELDGGITPVDRDASRKQRLDDFLRRVPGLAFVLDFDCEL